MSVSVVAVFNPLAAKKKNGGDGMERICRPIWRGRKTTNAYYQVGARNFFVKRVYYMRRTVDHSRTAPRAHFSHLVVARAVVVIVTCTRITNARRRRRVVRENGNRKTFFNVGDIFQNGFLYTWPDLDAVADTIRVHALFFKRNFRLQSYFRQYRVAHFFFHLRKVYLFFISRVLTNYLL